MPGSRADRACFLFRSRPSIPHRQPGGAATSGAMKPGSTDMSAQPELIDSFGPRIESLRVSVTDRCNSCGFYCMPRAGARFRNSEDLLSNDEMARLIPLFSGLGGARGGPGGGEGGSAAM